MHWQLFKAEAPPAGPGAREDTEISLLDLICEFSTKTLLIIARKQLIRFFRMTALKIEVMFKKEKTFLAQWLAQ